MAKTAAANSQKQGRKLPEGRPFQKGQSGNPSGRPKEIRDVVAAARQHTLMAIERLAYWAKSDHPAASPNASSILLDRGWGKAPQTINLGDAPEMMSDEQLALLATNPTNEGET